LLVELKSAGGSNVLEKEEGSLSAILSLINGVNACSLPAERCGLGKKGDKN